MSCLRHLGWSIMLAALLVPVPRSAAGAADDDGTSKQLNQKVISFARAQLGKQVGRGECSNLAIEALKAARAKTTDDFGVSGLGKDYIWGKLIEKYEDGQPGDILQFRDAKLQIKVGAKGSQQLRIAVIPHHTALIAANLGTGKFKVLEQNVNGVKKVQETEMDLASKTEGKFWVYRPVKK